MKGWHAIALSPLAAILAVGSCLPDVTVQGSTQARPCGDGLVDPAAGEECDPGPDAGDGGVLGCGADCRVRCSGVIDPTTGHCYFTGSPTARVQAARDGCGQSGAHLVAFQTSDELGFVESRVLADAGGAVLWVNLDRQDVDGAARWRPDLAQEPGWSGACPGCYAKAAPDASAFANADGGPGGACVAWARAYPYAWFAVPCDLGLIPLSPVCEREPPGAFVRACEAGACLTASWTSHDRTYVYVPTPRSWADASAACASMSGPVGPGVLFVPHDAEERVEVARAVIAGKGQAFWLGLSRSSGAWTWSDGKSLASLVYASPWGDGAPEASGSAAYVEVDTARYDVTLAHAGDPSTPRPFVCGFELRAR